MDRQLKGFDPIVDTDSELLILGSMPGVVSLTKNEYYGHSQNLFWRILADIFKGDPDASYEAKVALLKSNKIALWDVLSACERDGSLDSAIVPSSMVANDFNHFYKRYPKIKRVLFNGIFAEKSYKKLVIQTVNTSLHMHRLPSTSPAHARLTYQEKLVVWNIALIGN